MGFSKKPFDRKFSPTEENASTSTLSLRRNIMKKEQREFYDLEGLWGEMNLTDALS